MMKSPDFLPEQNPIPELQQSTFELLNLTPETLLHRNLDPHDLIIIEGKLYIIPYATKYSDIEQHAYTAEQFEHIRDLPGLNFADGSRSIYSTSYSCAVGLRVGDVMEHAYFTKDPTSIYVRAPKDTLLPVSIERIPDGFSKETFILLLQKLNTSIRTTNFLRYNTQVQMFTGEKYRVVFSRPGSTTINGIYFDIVDSVLRINELIDRNTERSKEIIEASICEILLKQPDITELKILEDNNVSVSDFLNS
jgi:hypothetical protein